MTENLNNACNTAFTEIAKVRDFLISGEAMDAPPREVVKAHTRCTGWYSYLCSREADCIAAKAGWWSGHRPDHKSDASTDRAWERTEAGILQTRIELEKKGLERIINAFNRLEDNIDREARNTT